MPSRTQWQYCQIETKMSGTGVLKQFFADRLPVETELHQNWPAMLGKLGEQGWELVSVLTNEGGLGRLGTTYVFKRPVGSTAGSQPTPIAAQTVSTPTTPPPAPPEPPEPPEPKSPTTGFDPIRGT